MGKRPVTVRVARWSAEHPWRAIALWVVFVAVCFVGGSAAGLNEASDEDQAIGEAGRASVIEIHGDFEDPAVENVLITAPSGQLDRAAADAAAADAIATRVRNEADRRNRGQLISRDSSLCLDARLAYGSSRNTYPIPRTVWITLGRPSRSSLRRR